MSIRFEDFYKKGDGGFHYFLTHTIMNTKWFLTWIMKKILQPETKYSDYASSIYPQMATVRNNTIFKNENDEMPNFDFNRSKNYHFDATKFGIWLKDNFCTKRCKTYC